VMSNRRYVSPSRYRLTSVVVIFLSLVSILSVGLQMSAPASAQGVGKQVFGATNNIGVIGAEADTTAPNIGINNGWASGIVAVSQYDLGPGFIETGAIKDCNESPACPTRPYTAYQSVGGGNYTFHSDTGHALGPGLYYHFYSNRVGGNTWQGIWCDGGGCGQLAQADLGTGSLPYALSGSETSGGPGGGFTHANNALTDGNGNTGGWCYARAVGFGEPNPPANYIGGCNGTSWTTNLP
jgi:hypothetical protein